jgi:hypothetical protein
LLTYASARADDARPVSFSREVLPLFSENCFTCHGPDSRARKADLRLDRKESALRARDPVIVPGKSAESELLRRISSRDPDEVMPPPRTGRKLTGRQVEVLSRWIDQGAIWGKHWAFEPPVRAIPPSVSDTSWVRNPIDQFMLARLEAERLLPAPEAARTTLVRRLFLDLTGLPPAPGDLDAVLEERGADALGALVDRLLASPQYGERMATDWLDAARYADTNGYQNDFARTMWPWRDWVITALNGNQPYDAFLTDQLAGDLVPGAGAAQKIATGFNRNNRTVTEAGSIDEEWRVENAVDRVETTATVFLGLTMGCCRCHEHKYDPISQGEFYQFFAFFNSLKEQGVYTEQRGNVPPLMSLASAEDKRRIRDLEYAIAAATGRSDRDESARLTREKAAFEERVPSVMVMEDLPRPRDTFVLKRGRYDMPDAAAKVEPGVPACLPSLQKGAPRNRLGLARWMADPGNPLTARVAVNRIWQHHFGVGLVKTAENFGLQGEPPLHADLLDWLAMELIRTGWNVKAIHRLIVTSATYGQASDASTALAARDPENRLLARGPRYRLPAELVRDNALALSGLLVTTMGGPSVKPYQPAGLWEELAGGAGEGPYVQDKGPALYRRSLYIYRKRTVPHPALATFDAPSRETCQVKRARTNTPLQALELLNDLTYVEAARALAVRARREGGPDDCARIRYAFRRATARAPSPRELALLADSLKRYRDAYQRDPGAARQWIEHGENPPDARENPAELAAFTALASVILNLDETITLE